MLNNVLLLPAKTCSTALVSRDEISYTSSVSNLISYRETRVEVNIATVDEWSRKFRKYGIAGIKTKPQKGNRHLLTREEKDEIKRTIGKKKPEDVGLTGKFWNVPTLKRYVSNAYQIAYRSLTSYRRLFSYCGFTFHKPVKVNRKQKAGVRRRFEVTLKKRSDGTREKAVWYW
jgi:transposase